MKAIPLAGKLLVVSAAIATLASCGGGGGGGGGGGPSGPPPSTPVALTAANAQTATDEVLGASLSFVSVGAGTSGGGLVPFSARVGARQQKLQALIAILREQLGRLNDPPQASMRIPLAPMQSACDGGGTQSVDPEPPTTPTSNTVTFVNCTSSGTTINGSLMVTNITNPSAGTTTGHVSHNLTVAQAGSPTVASSGEFDVSENTNGTVITDTLTGGPINLQVDSDVVILSGFTLTSTIDSSNSSTTDSFVGTVATTLLGGSVTVATPTTFEAASGHSPNTGQLLITGKAGSTVRFTVLGDETTVGSQVRIEVDPEGDGTFLPPVETTWADL